MEKGPSPLAGRSVVIESWGSLHRLSIAPSPHHLIVERHIVIQKVIQPQTRQVGLPRPAQPQPEAPQASNCGGREVGAGKAKALKYAARTPYLNHDNSYGHCYTTRIVSISRIVFPTVFPTVLLLSLLLLLIKLDSPTVFTFPHLATP